MTEDIEESTVNSENTEQSRTKVGFPQAPEKPSSFPWKIIIIVLVLILLGVGAWWLLSGKSEESLTSEVIPTSGSQVIEDSVSTSTPVPEEVDKGDIQIQVLNGTGVTGGAGSLQKELQKIGYSTIDVGNANKSTYTTTEVVFNTNIDETVKTEIMKKLQEIYSRVTSQDKDLNKYDIQITTGLLKGQTAVPTQKLTSTPSPTSKVSASPSLSPTPSLTLTPTPTP